MKRNLPTILKLGKLLLLGFATIGQLVAQTQSSSQSGQQPLYRLVDLGTFGGPASYFSLGYDGVLNNHGAAAGWAETSEENPLCFFGCIHAFQAQDAVLTDLGVLPGGLFSLASWISANGLITGFSDNGQFDPVYGIIEIHPFSGEMAGLLISAYCRRAELEAWREP
jgi:hypothetical protein